MSRKKTIITILLAVGGSAVIGCILVSGYATLMGAILSDTCGNYPLSEIASPDRIHKAIIFERDCGATTGFSTQVSVLSSGAKLPNEYGNVFVVFREDASVPSGSGGGPKVDVKWTGNNAIQISYNAKARASIAVESFDGVKITYQKE